MRDTERGKDTGRGRSRLPTEAQCRTWSQDPGITPWAKGRCSTTEPPRHPHTHYLCLFPIYSQCYLASTLTLSYQHSPCVMLPACLFRGSTNVAILVFLRVPITLKNCFEGCLAGVVSGTGHNSWSQGCKFKFHVGYRDYLKTKYFLKIALTAGFHIWKWKFYFY